MTNNLTADDIWGNKAMLEDYDGDFPFTVVFHDIQDNKVKEMEVSEEAWNDTLKTFGDNDNVTRSVIYKYMSKHDSVTTEPYFKEG